MDLEVLPRDLSAYRRGNTGIDYVHRFVSDMPGPDVVVNALTHGNEFCGMVAVVDLLESGVRPLKGSLTLSFANVAAYESFDPARPYESRQLVHNFNRIWIDSMIDGSERSPELDRAREMRPVFAAADYLLDIHSTSQAVEPFWVYRGLPRHADLALSLSQPITHMVMPGGLGSGVSIIEYRRFADPLSHATGMVVECGQHFLQQTADVAKAVTREWLAHTGVVEYSGRPPVVEHRQFELLQTCMVRTPAFKFTGPYIGFERFDKGELIAIDGVDEIRAPCQDCTILMPTREPKVGREAVYLTRPVSRGAVPR